MNPSDWQLDRRCSEADDGRPDAASTAEAQTNHQPRKPKGGDEAYFGHGLPVELGEVGPLLVSRAQLSRKSLAAEVRKILWTTFHGTRGHWTRPSHQLPNIQDYPILTVPI